MFIQCFNLFNYEANQSNIFGNANRHSDFLVIRYIIVKPAVAQIQGLPGKCYNHIKTTFSQRQKEYSRVLDHTQKWIATKDAQIIVYFTLPSMIYKLIHCRHL